MTVHIGYSPVYLQWEGSHASPMRAHLAVEHIKARAADENVTLNHINPSTSLTNRNADKRRLKEIHDPKYVDAMFDGTYSAHPGEQGSLVAPMMFAGTRALVQAMENAGMPSEVFFNPQGAKHHAAYSHSSGFCAFNDMAWAAKHFTDQGLKVAYLDWDAHHGDGVEDLTRKNKNVMTVSIHQGGIFPGTGLHSKPHAGVWNFPLEAGDGDWELTDAVDQALVLIEDFEPDVLLMAIGADGHESDPLANLKFTVEGFGQVAEMVGEYVREAGIPVLVGGAGGYQPFSYVPLIWAEVIMSLNAQISMEQHDLNIDVVISDEMS